VEKSELTALVNHLCEVQRQMFFGAQELTLGIVALQRMMEEYHPGFEKACRAKIQDLRHGEVGQKLAHDKAAFEQAIQLTKASLLA
jgi:hypothetical protein